MKLNSNSVNFQCLVLTQFYDFVTAKVITLKAWILLGLIKINIIYILQSDSLCQSKPN
jgi:hypothetical protein